jgi:hypothetical protein
MWLHSRQRSQSMPAFVKAAVASGSGGTGAFTVPITFTPTTASDTLIALVNLQGSTTTAALNTYLSSVTDNATGGSSTYVQPTTNFGTVSNTVVSYNSWILYCNAVKAGVTTITANFNTSAWVSNFSSILILEYSGLGVFDVIGATTAANSTTTRSSGSVSVASGDTAIGVIIDWSNAAVTAVTSPNTAFDYRDTTPATYASASAIQGITGSNIATFTVSAGTEQTITSLLAFKALTSTFGGLRLLGVGNMIAVPPIYPLLGGAAMKFGQAIRRNARLSRRQMLGGGGLREP